jgi:hypothetical protein
MRIYPFFHTYIIGKKAYDEEEGKYGEAYKPSESIDRRGKWRHSQKGAKQ